MISGHMGLSLRGVVLLMLPSTTSSAYLGLRNQGNTCYMNSLLQSLHHLPEFRQAIYTIPTKLRPNASSAADNQIPLELQRVFYHLECAELAGASEVGTEQLTRSFGWTRADVMVQQDVQEFARMLCDALQQSMRAHGVRDAVAELFEGRTSSLTRCTRVDFASEKEERFYDLQLQVQGCRNLQASLRHFVHEERLTGSNQYNTRDPQLGKQDACRATRFKSLPPVLQLHLKRFEYDAETGGMHKLQQAFAFPTRLMLHKFMAASAAADAPPPDYELAAVLSHAGGAGSGHYIAYVRPRGSKQWWEFDDTRVTPVAEHVAVKQQFGGRHSRGGGVFGGAPNAYMLVYVRRDAAETAAEGGEGEAAAALPSEVRDAFERELGLRKGQRGAPGRAAVGRGASAAAEEAAPVVEEEYDYAS